MTWPIASINLSNKQTNRVLEVQASLESPRKCMRMYAKHLQAGTRPSQIQIRGCIAYYRPHYFVFLACNRCLLYEILHTQKCQKFKMAANVGDVEPAGAGYVYR